MSRKKLPPPPSSPRTSRSKRRLRPRPIHAILAVTLLVGGVTVYLLGVRLLADYHYDAAAQFLEGYDYEQASAQLDKYLSLRPTEPQGLLLAAQTARRRGDFVEAERRLRLAERHGAPADETAPERVLLRVQMGDLTEAAPLAKFCTGHAAEPSGALALEAIIEGSMTAFNLKLTKWAVDLWLEQRRGTTAQVQGLVWRGRLNELVQNFPRALADFRRAVELDPDHRQARLRLVVALVRDEPHEAFPHLEWMRRRRPDDPEVRFQTARLRRNLGQPEEAGQLLDEVLAAAPDKFPALVERGRVALDLHHPEQAEHWLRRALEVAPGQREVCLALSDCLRQSGRLEEAKQYREKVDEIDARLKKALDETTGMGGP